MTEVISQDTVLKIAGELQRKVKDDVDELVEETNKKVEEVKGELDDLKDRQDEVENLVVPFQVDPMQLNWGLRYRNWPGSGGAGETFVANTWKVIPCNAFLWNKYQQNGSYFKAFQDKFLMFNLTLNVGETYKSKWDAGWLRSGQTEPTVIFDSVADGCTISIRGIVDWRYDHALVLRPTHNFTVPNMYFFGSAMSVSESVL